MRDYDELVVDLQKMRSTEYCVITSATDFPAHKILRESICAIEELVARVPDKNVGEWISVEERLPHYLDHAEGGGVMDDKVQMPWCPSDCVYYPPSSFDGKPCTVCDITDPIFNCYEKMEGGHAE